MPIYSTLCAYLVFRPRLPCVCWTENNRRQSKITLTLQPRILIEYYFTSWEKTQALWDAEIQEKWFYSNCRRLILWMYPQKEMKRTPG